MNFDFDATVVGAGAVGLACRVAAVRVSHASSRGWLADIPTTLLPTP